MVKANTPAWARCIIGLGREAHLRHAIACVTAALAALAAAGAPPEK